MTVCTFGAFQLVPWHQFGMRFPQVLNSVVFWEMIGLYAPLALFMSALAMALAASARTFKEAQSLVTLVIPTPALPLLVTLGTPLSGHPWLAPVPVVGQFALAMDLLTGASPSWYWFGVLRRQRRTGALFLSSSRPVCFGENPSSLDSEYNVAVSPTSSRTCVSSSRSACLALAALAQPRVEHYGYTLRKSLADDGLKIEESTLYPLLRRLEAQGLLVSEWREENKRRKRFYRLSRDGEAVLSELLETWTGIDAALNRILRRTARRRTAAR